MHDITPHSCDSGNAGCRGKKTVARVNFPVADSAVEIPATVFPPSTNTVTPSATEKLFLSEKQSDDGGGESGGEGG